MYDAKIQPILLRLPQIIGDRKKGIPAIIPVSRTTWFDGVKSGRFPQPIRLSEGVVAWRTEDILAIGKKGQ